MEDLSSDLQDGSGLQKVAPLPARRKRRFLSKREIKDVRHHIQQNLQMFQSYGWRKAYIAKMFDSDLITLVRHFTHDRLKQQLHDDWIRLNKPDLSPETLYDLGLRKSVAKKYFDIIDGLLESSYSSEQLLDVIVEHAYNGYEPCGGRRSRYLYEQSIVEKAINIAIDDKSFVLYNMQQPISKDLSAIIKSRMVGQLERVLPNTKTSVYFFHATGWSYAQDIIKNGLDHTRGRPCLDFGSKNAFYMTPQVSVAVDYCCMSTTRWKNECCILVYKVSKSFQFDKIYDSVNDNWRKNVRLSRMCIENELDSCDTVYGPMLYNVRSMLDKGDTPRSHDRPQFQMVSRSKIVDEWLDKCLYALVTFAKY